jgi:hypothetical protein
MMRSQHHTAHTHTTDLKPSIAPIEAPSSAPLPLTTSRERVAIDNVEAPPHRCESRGWQPPAPRPIDNVEAPPHRCESRGWQPPAPRRHRLCLRSRCPRMSELRLMMPRRLAIVVQSGVDRRLQRTSSLSRSGFDRRRGDTGTPATLAV